MDVEQIRKDFPALQRKYNERPVIYFDNACMTLKPKPVIEAILDYYENFPSCGGRSVHKFGTEVTIKIDESREAMKKFINASRKEEIIFTKNTTESLSFVANGLKFEKDDIVVSSDKEHNSNLLPWQRLKILKGIHHVIIPSNTDNTFNIEALKECVSKYKKRIKLMSFVHQSNLDGVVIPAEEIVEIAHDNGSPVLLDCAQSVPHREVDVKKLDVDFIAFSVHKMCGPTGVGVLYGKYDLLKEMNPLIAGGGTVESTTYDNFKFLMPPERFEAGLQNYAGIVGAKAAAEYLSKLGKNNIEQHEIKLNKYVTDSLRDYPEILILGPEKPELRHGIFPFNIKGFEAHDVALILDEVANIMLRSGAHCVHSWFEARKIKGCARASFFIYNTLEEAKIFVENIKKLIQGFEEV